MLIVISGPVASGKSTVARALVQEVERRGATAAVVDLDVVYDMLEHNDARKADATKWLTAQHAAAALCDTLDDGRDRRRDRRGRLLDAERS
jgi:uridine kinase